MGAQVEIWPDNSTSIIVEDVNGDEPEPDTVEGEISAADIRASQVSLFFVHLHTHEIRSIQMFLLFY